MARSSQDSPLAATARGRRRWVAQFAHRLQQVASRSSREFALRWRQGPSSIMLRDMRWRRRRRDEDDPPSYFSPELTAEQIEFIKNAAERHAEAEAAALGAAVRAVRANRRGKSTAEVADELESQLAASGRSLPREVLAYFAREIAEPHWRLRHPVEFVREVRASRRLRDEDPFGDFGDSFSFEEAAGEEGFSELLHQVREKPEVRSARFAPDDPEVIEVVLLPWSESSAQRLRDFCLPHQVRFVDGLPQWREWDDRWP